MLGIGAETWCRAFEFEQVIRSMLDWRGRGFVAKRGKVAGKRDHLRRTAFILMDSLSIEAYRTIIRAFPWGMKMLSIRRVLGKLKSDRLSTIELSSVNALLAGADIDILVS